MTRSLKRTVAGTSTGVEIEIDASSTAISSGVSLDVLCRRAERLIDSVRMMGEQVNRMFSRPDEVVADANDAARRLADLRDDLEARLEAARQGQASCSAQIGEFHKLLPTIQQLAEGLIQRVMRARELSDSFARLIDSGADKLAAIDSAAHEAVKAREAIGNAIQELLRVQKKADQWAESVRLINAKQAEFLKSGNAVAMKLRTLSDAGERLRETARQDVVELRELLRESRIERLAWEQLLARMPAAANVSPTSQTVTSQTATSQGPAPSPGTSVPAVLARRVSRLAGYIRSATSTLGANHARQAPCNADQVPSNTLAEAVGPAPITRLGKSPAAEALASGQ
jgi:hypothetical protein